MLTSSWLGFSALASALEDKAKWSECTDFFHKEYELDSFIAKMKTPVVSFLHGASSKPNSSFS